MSCTTELNDILKAIKALEEKHPEKTAKAIKLFNKAKASMFEAKFLEKVAMATTDTKMSTQEAITKMLEEDGEYQLLLKELEDIEAGVEASIAKYAKAAENRKEKGGRGAAESADLNVIALEERIEDNRKETLKLKVMKAKGINSPKYVAKINNQIGRLNNKRADLEEWLKESKAVRKASKTRATKTENLKDKRNTALEAKNEIKELIREYENNFTTGGQLLARMRTNDRIVKSETSAANDFNLADYFEAKATSTDIENMDTRLAEDMMTTDGTKSNRTKNLRQASNIFQTIGKGLQTFIQGLDSTSPIHIGESGSVEGFQNLARLFISHPGKDRRAKRVLDPYVE